MNKFKLLGESERREVYAYKTDYDNMSIIFNKELKCVDIQYSHFVLREPMLEPQWENEKDEWLKHSCKYGHWQSETIICLSAEDISWINNKCKEIFGK